MSFLYSLEKGSKKIVCPDCGEKSYTRYVNTETSEYLPDHVGWCDRRNKCKRSYNAKDYFADNPDEKPARTFNSKPVQKKPSKFIPDEYVESTLQYDGSNTLIKYLKSLFGSAITKELVRLYQIGTCDKWPGAAIFWVTDYHFRTRSGQIVQLDETGHTVKYKDNEGNRVRRTSWMHKYLEYQKNRPEWLTDYLDNPECWPCLFGEHLLQDNPEMPVAIVEAPKTAIIASVYFPQFIWLAIGSMNNLSVNRPDRLAALKGRRVVLFPDLKAYDNWREKAAALLNITPITVAPFLEENATESEKELGLDLADFLTRFSIADFHLTCKENQQET